MQKMKMAALLLVLLALSVTTVTSCARVQGESKRKLKITSSSTFTPESISGLKIWLKADAIDTLVDGDPVDTWEDSSVNANDATQAIIGQRPLYKTNQINGLPAIVFDGIDDTLSMPVGAKTYPEGSTFIVMKALDNLNNEFFATTDTTDKPEIRLYNDATLRIYSNGAYRVISTIGGAPYFTNTASLVTLLLNTTEYELYTNGTLDLGAALGVSLESNAPILNLLGGYPPSARWANVKIAEVIMFNRLVTASEQLNLETYLNEKYDLY